MAAGAKPTTGLYGARVNRGQQQIQRHPLMRPQSSPQQSQQQHQQQQQRQQSRSLSRPQAMPYIQPKPPAKSQQQQQQQHQAVLHLPPPESFAASTFASRKTGESGTGESGDGTTTTMATTTAIKTTGVFPAPLSTRIMELVFIQIEAVLAHARHEDIDRTETLADVSGLCVSRCTRIRDK